MSVDGKRVWVTEYIQCTTECGLEAGDQSAARLAQLIIGYVGGCVHAEGSARELILYTLPLIRNLASTLKLGRLWIDFMLWLMELPIVRCNLLLQSGRHSKSCASLCIMVIKSEPKP